MPRVNGQQTISRTELRPVSCDEAYRGYLIRHDEDHGRWIEKNGWPVGYPSPTATPAACRILIDSLLDGAPMPPAIPECEA